MTDGRFSLTGKVALVTGASSGLGEHFAETLAQAGATVVVAARRSERLADLVARIADAGGTSYAVALDVTDPASVAAGFKTAQGVAGPPDIIVNNAGISIVGKTLDYPLADWDQVVNTNLRGAWLVAQAGAQQMVDASKPGRIVNIASILGLRTIGQVAPYTAAKAGLLHLTRVLAMEWARYRIQVNAIAPGYIETEMNGEFWRSPGGRRLIERIPQRRLGKPADLDGPLLLLCSDAGAFMTGAVLTVDGGHTSNSL